MTRYYRPTSFTKKVKKIVQLYTLFLQARLRPRSTRTKTTPSPAVLMLVPHLDYVGGLERQSIELAGALSRLGNWITTLTDRRDKFPGKEFQNGFLIYRIPSRLQPTKINLLFSLLFFFVRHRKSYQIVHAHGVTGFTLFGLRLAKLFNMKTILKGATKNDFVNLFTRNDQKHRIYRRWMQKVDCFIAISEELRSE